MVDLTGRVGLVTEAGGGLGRQHALFLARYGAKVVVNDVSKGNADAVADAIASSGGEAMWVVCSVTDFEAVSAMAAQPIERWAHVDILANKAGILRDRPFAKRELADVLGAGTDVPDRIVESRGETTRLDSLNVPGAVEGQGRMELRDAGYARGETSRP